MRRVHRLWLLGLFVCLAVALLARRLEKGVAQVADRPILLATWKTNWDRHLIDPGQLQSGGPGKDGIPALLTPKFMTVEQARDWIAPNEPVVVLTLGETTRAYPLQILIWHEIVNDELEGLPVAVTFCPLCHSAIVFDRRITEHTLTLGVSGFLRHSDMMMYDHQTESLWQQFSGEALVGDLVGHTLKRLPSQILSFEQFANVAPQGFILSQDTGYTRPYGRNPYAGYDIVGKQPFLYRGPHDDRLLPMERVVGLTLDGKSKAYPYRALQQLQVINEQWSGRSFVVFWQPGTLSALDQESIVESKSVGATGVFDCELDGRRLSFLKHDEGFVDQQTGSLWTLTGKAVKGPLTGKQLIPIVHGDFFAFAFLVFYPDTEVFDGL